MCVDDFFLSLRIINIFGKPKWGFEFKTGESVDHSR